MKNPPATILFDMDNTLFDLVGAQIAACNAIVKFFGRSDGDRLFEDYFLRGQRGYESHENIHDYMLDFDVEDDGNYKRACLIYEEVKLNSVVPYDGVRSTLSALQDENIPMAVITDAHSRDAMRRLEKTGLSVHFTAVIAFDMVRVKKPAAAPFLFALEIMRSDPEETILIGDSPVRDICPAHDLGMRTVYARYGDRFSVEKTCPQADYTIDRMQELLSIVHPSSCS